MTVEELREALGADRVILRLERPDALFPVVEESTAPGVKRIIDETPIDLRSAPTFLWVERELRPLVQHDTSRDEPIPPPEILEFYGVRAQVLAPVVRAGRLAGIVGAHFTREPHRWTDGDLELIGRAVRAADWRIELEHLLAATGASRTTVRAESPDAYFPIAAEALAPGVPTLRTDTTIDLRAAPTMQFLLRERRTLVQDDCAAGEHAPPPELIASYGVRSQLLAPIVRDDRLVAFVSVHDMSGPRRWTDAEVAAAERVAERIGAELDRAVPPPPGE